MESPSPALAEKSQISNEGQNKRQTTLLYTNYIQHRRRNIRFLGIRRKTNTSTTYSSGYAFGNQKSSD